MGFYGFDLGKEIMEGWWSFWSAIKENRVWGNWSNKVTKQRIPTTNRTEGVRINAYQDDDLCALIPTEA